MKHESWDLLIRWMTSKSREFEKNSHPLFLKDWQRERKARTSKAFVSWATIIGAGASVIGAVGTVAALVPIYWPQPVSSRFSCGLQPDLNRGNVAWTVMYGHDKGPQAWLKLKSESQCVEVAQKLENYRRKKLTELAIYADPEEDRQYIICAKTRIGGESYLPLTTWKPKADFKQELYQIAGTLLPIGLNQSSDNLSASNSSLSLPVVINVEDQLADNDRQAN